MFVCGELLLGAAVYVNEVSGLKIHSTANVRDANHSTAKDYELPKILPH